MTIAMIFFATLISVMFTFDFIKMIIEMRRDRVVMKSMKREAGGFGV